MSKFHDFEWASDTLATARDKSAGKPIGYATRLFQRDDDSIAVKQHSTDVVTIHRDGTYTLRAGGWHTVTTADRIRTYSPAHLLTERGEWFIRLEPNPDDPQPELVRRSVPKPFITMDPGAEPVKNELGCQAGSMLGTEHVDELVHLTFRSDMREGDEFVEVTLSSRTDEKYDSVNVKRTWTSWVFYGEEAYAYQNKEWNAPGTDKRDVTYQQCPHCAEFNRAHEQWHVKMHGVRWGGGPFDRAANYGWLMYDAMMTKFGGLQEWHDAYLTDLRARKAYLKADREWEQRNRVPFYDGIVVDSDGYAPRLRKNGPSPAKLRRHQAAVERMQKRIDKYVDGFIKQLVKGMPMPSNGDCWYCMMRQSDTGMTLGDDMDTLHSDGSLSRQPSHEHLLSHMQERYYVPSLLTNAMLERGMKPLGVMMMLDMDPVRPGDDKMVGTDRMGGRGSYKDARRNLRKYLSKRLIPTAPTE